MREAVKVCRDYAAAGKGPIFLEAKTYRYHGHSMSDPGITYRNREEVSGVRQARDPVQLVKSWLLDKAGATVDELKVLELRVRDEIDAAVEAAKAADPPPASELTRDIYVGSFPPPRMCNV
jgi:pyruvate dehydrogenase E1 component alpha subunit